MDKNPHQSGRGKSTPATQRERWRTKVEAYVAQHTLVPPLSIEELRNHAETLSDDPMLQEYTMVLLNNAVWSDTVASIPFDRRLLLLPQCLRHVQDCMGEIDEMGLLCVSCGRCVIGSLQTLAEELGYVVLVAEGSTMVSRLLQSGKVDAVIGVSCLQALEKSFPHMADMAIPGLAIPLSVAGCIGTEVNVQHVETAIRMRSDHEWKNRLDTEQIRSEVQGWFTPDAFACKTQTETIAYDWLLQDGKRWRPFLLACTYAALTGETNGLPDSVRRLAIAVECFHKASLVHDDIEDQDELRYGEQTLHAQHGVPVALNAGDLLVGEGYRWISSVEHHLADLLSIASENHRMLCLGQGEELIGRSSDKPFSTAQIIEIFRKKTAPAFGVSLQLGAIAAGADSALCDMLQAYSESLGIAYQIRDDLEEFQQYQVTDLNASILFAIAVEAGEGLVPMERNGERIALTPFARNWLESMMAPEKAQQLLEHHKREAIRALNPLQNAPLKQLLRRVTTKILRGS